MKYRITRDLDGWYYAEVDDNFRWLRISSTRALTEQDCKNLLNEYIKQIRKNKIRIK